MADVRVPAGPPGRLDDLRDGEVLQPARARGEELRRTCGLCPAGMAGRRLVALGVHDQRGAELAEDAQGLGHQPGIDRREVRGAGIGEEALEADYPGLPERPELGEVAGNHPAPEGDVDVALALRGLSA